jgi:Helix-turn-helix domain
MPRAASDWITLADAAAILGSANVHFRPSTIGAWARRGDLQSIKVGGRRYVRRAEVRRLVAPPRRVRAEDVQAGLFEDLSG